jgi:hypothetical protein
MCQIPSLFVNPSGSYQYVFYNRVVKSSWYYAIKNIEKIIAIGQCLGIPRNLIAKNNSSKNIKDIMEVVN